MRKVTIIVAFCLVFLSFFFISEHKTYGQNAALGSDTTQLANDTLLLGQQADSTNRNTYISPTKSYFATNVDYGSEDSTIMEGTSIVHLYNKAHIKFEDMDLNAYYIRLNLDSSIVYACGRRDSTGALVDLPEFVQGGTNYKQHEITYNFETGKGFIRHVVTQQGEGFVTGQKNKRMPDGSFCMADGDYTTCEYHDHPHFSLHMTKAKVKPGKFIATGPAYLIMEDVPIYPLFIPFGYFPFTDKFSSGFLMPSYGEESTRGFYLRDGGYYFALNNKMDLNLTGDIFTKGSWGLRASSRYANRYKYNGNFNIRYMINITGEKELPDYSKTKDFSISWSHSKDPKSSPYSSLSASVDFSSTSYERNNLETYYNPAALARNHKSSSVSYAKRWAGKPMNLSINGLIQQNSADQTVNVSLPQISFSVSRITPFKIKDRVGKEKWFEKIGTSYTFTSSNSFSGLQSNLFNSNLIRDWSNGAKHSIPVSTSFNLLKYINLSPSINYNERWYSYKTVVAGVKKDRYNADSLAYERVYGFNRVWDYSASLGASTKLYGFYRPIKAIFGDKVEAIRHVMTPSVSMNWHPDFGDPKYGYYARYPNDTTGSKYYSLYSGALYGNAPQGKFGGLSFSLGNNLEMKLRKDPNDTSTVKNQNGTDKNKITLLERLSISSGYNLAVDSFQWQGISISANSRLFKGLSLNMNATLDPYVTEVVNGVPVRRNVTYFSQNHTKIGQLTNMSASTGYAFDDQFFKKLFGGEDKTDKTKADGSTENSEVNNEKANKNNIPPNGYYPFAIPWNISFSYSYQLSHLFNRDTKAFEYVGSSNLGFSGSMKLTPLWNINFSSGYDFRMKEIASTSMNITRSLHCWNMSLGLVPFGRYKSYNFLIRVNSGMLQDLKYEKRKNGVYDPGFGQ